MMKLKQWLAAMGCALLMAGCGSPVTQPQNDIFPFPCKTRHRAYYVDRNGMEITAISDALEEIGVGEYWHPDFLQDGLIRVDTSVDRERVIKFLDEKGNTVVDMIEVARNIGLNEGYFNIMKCTDFSQGVAFIQLGLDVYAISKEGKLLYEFEGFPLSAFGSDGYAYFEDLHGNVGIMDTEGKIIVEPNEDIIASKVPPVCKTYLARDNSSNILMDFDGKPLGATWVLSVLDKNDCVIVYTDGGKGVADKTGKILFSGDYKTLENDGEWYYYIKDGEVGWCDKNGDIKIGPLYESGLQTPHSRYYWYPQPFYGSGRSVGTETYFSETDHNTSYFSWAATVKQLQKISEGDGKLYADLMRNDECGVILTTPVVKGRAVGINTYEKAYYVYEVTDKTITAVGNAFASAYDYWQLYAVGEYCLNPAIFWHGLRE